MHTKKSHSEGSPCASFSCSFCGKSEADGVLIIIGPMVYICSECIAACTEILLELREDTNGNK